ncbi:MAG: CBS domain-containing protein [Leptolyngbyaceae bacterium]|nr:CBS domain-containing protein [Leptolyngbyaceae bacterium]
MLSLATNPAVKDVMTPDPVSVASSTPLTQAIQLIAERHISGMPVVEADGKLAGVISESDLMWQETGANPPPYIMVLDSIIYLENPATFERELHKALGQTVGEVMTKTVVTITPDAPLKQAAQLLHRHNIHRLIVVDQAKAVVGILTRGDIIRYMASHQEE